MRTQREQAQISRRGKQARQVDFKVTAKHCALGCRNNAANCMVAQAIMEKIPHATHVHVTTREVSWSDPVSRERHRYFNTPTGDMAVRRFDAGLPVTPFALHLNDGITFPMGWKAKHPGSTRKGKTYRRTGKTGVRYSKHRTFGANNIKGYEESLEPVR